jgi:hypothetical protein
MQQELEEIQACASDDDCGEPLEGTSCGCTRNLVANKSADTTRFEELQEAMSQNMCDGLVSTCDCPEADGFACVQDRCTWNYVSAGGECKSTPADRVCIRGIPLNSGERLEPGMPLALTVTPSGCYSSSCTEAKVAACQIESDVQGKSHSASAEFCLVDTSGGGACTADCGGGGFANCESEVLLTEGKHTLEIGGKSISFEVPGVLTVDENCIDISP